MEYRPLNPLYEAAAVGPPDPELAAVSSPVPDSRDGMMGFWSGTESTHMCDRILVKNTSLKSLRKHGNKKYKEHDIIRALLAHTFSALPEMIEGITPRASFF